MTVQRPRIFDLVVRADGVPWPLIEGLLLRFGRTLVVKGASEAEWERACARSRVVVVAGGAEEAARVAIARAQGATPIALRGAVDGSDLVRAIVRCLEDPGREPLAGARPLRVVLNHGGLVAQELAGSLAAFGWELRPLLGAGPDPLASADFLLVLPYGDPHGALEAVRRARRASVPTALWNVEDPRYFFHPEYGPVVRALAEEASITFSTTTQLRAEYEALGVSVHYLPNYARSHFFVERPLEETNRSIDILFLGTSTPERVRFLERVRADLGGGVRLVARDDVRDPGEQRRLVASARLGLSFGTLTDAETPRGPLRGEGLTERVFDYPLAGTPVLSDERAHLADHLVDGETVFVLGAEDPAARMRTLLADPARRALVMERARAEVLRRHLGRHRVLAIAEALVSGGKTESPAFARAVAAARQQELGGGSKP